MQTITTPDDLLQHIDRLIAIAPQFAEAYAETGVPTLRLRAGGFLQVCQTIVSQQLSVAAANSIWQRLTDNHLINPETLTTANDTELRACGLSKQKIRYLKSLAEHNIDYALLAVQDDATVIKTLTAVTGIGRWTAEIYLLFSLNRSDVFAANDLALQVAAQALFALPERPKERAMRQLAEQWAPHRSAAAYLLWAYYHFLKGREGV